MWFNNVNNTQIIGVSKRDTQSNIYFVRMLNPVKYICWNVTHDLVHVSKCGTRSSQHNYNHNHTHDEKYTVTHSSNKFMECNFS